MKKYFLLIAILLINIIPSKSWIFHEHRQIANAAILKLDSSRASVLQSLWEKARTGHEKRLSLNPADLSLDENAILLDFGAWPAIAGDHSCSADDMLNTILYTDWIIDVFRITSKYSQVMPKTFDLRNLSNLMRNQDIELQWADPEYATRAGSNNSHFLLARPRSFLSPREYAQHCFKTGQEINAIGVYVIYHISALNKINYAGKNKDLPEKIRNKIIISAFADEAFALHFLEDIFAAGHVAGTWGDASLRKGTHDFYNRQGLEIATWDNKSFVIMGDAHMTAQDVDSSSNVVVKSLAEFIDAYNDKLKINYPDLTIEELSVANSFNVCKTDFMPPISTFESDSSYNKYLTAILLSTPKPALAEGHGALPRFRSELGPFIGISSAAQFHSIFGGFSPEDKNDLGFYGSLEVGGRFGFGLEGVVNETADGLMFIDVGFKINSKSSSLFCYTEGCQILNQISAIIPARNAIYGRIRMPYFVIPGDLIAGLPLVGLIWPKTYESMAIIAANGGLIPWQTVMITNFGKFQFILGREIAFTFYGSFGSDNSFVRPLPDDGNDEENLLVMSVKSLALEFPIIEYRPFSTFSFDQSTSLRIQLNAGLEIPTSVYVENPPGFPVPDLKPMWSVGLRLVFDWRYYF